MSKPRRSSTSTQSRCPSAAAMCSSGRFQWLPVTAILRGCSRQQPVEIVRAALFGGGDDLAVEARRIDACLERAPARKAVVVGDRELRLVELRRGIARAQRGEPLLGGLLEPVDMGLRRKGLGHDTPSFSAPGVRGSRARKKGMECSSAEKVGSTLHADRRSPDRPCWNTCDFGKTCQRGPGRNRYAATSSPPPGIAIGSSKPWRKRI